MFGVKYTNRMFPADMVPVQPLFMTLDGGPASVLGAGRPLSRGGGTGEQLCRTASSCSHLLLGPQTQLLEEVSRLHHQVALIIWQGAEIQSHSGSEC